MRKVIISDLMNILNIIIFKSFNFNFDSNFINPTSYAFNMFLRNEVEGVPSYFDHLNFVVSKW